MPLINGSPCSGKERLIVNPYDNRLTVGSVTFAEPAAIDEALTEASEAFTDWRLCPVAQRAEYLKQAADLLESNRLELVSLCVREGGRTIKDALAEVREAVDFCRYYAQSALDLFGRADPAARSYRRGKLALSLRPRRLCLHQSVEFPDRHFYRPDSRGAGRRQYGHRQTGQPDRINRDALHPVTASGRHTRIGVAVFAGGRPFVWRAFTARSQSCRCGFHRFHGNGAVHQPAISRTSSEYCAADCRNRRTECADCRQFGIA